MAVFGQGAPGTRIRLRDLSEVSLVTSPTIVGGVAGFCTKGEFNRIIGLTGSSEMDVFLGGGYNNPKFNQALYATRSILDAGGYMEFVRLYGEAIIEDDTDDDYETSQKLKTDVFVVDYDFNSPLGAADQSINIEHFASTRYIQDGMVTLGDREIYTIQEAVVNYENTNFALDTDEVSTNKLPLFSVMNTDPTSANRAGTRFDISTIVATGTANVTVNTINPHNIQEGDTIIVGGTTNFNNSSAVVTGVSGTKQLTYDTSTYVTASEADGAVYNNDDTVASGVDSLTVKTAASGIASKRFQSITLDNIGTGTSATLEGYDLGGDASQGTDVLETALTTSYSIGMNMPDGSDVDFQFVESTVFPNKTAVPIVYGNFDGTDIDDVNNTISIANPTDFNVGDTVQFHGGWNFGRPVDDVITSLVYITPYSDYKVAGLSGTAMSINTTSGVPVDIGNMTPYVTASDKFKVVNTSGTLESLKTAMIAADATGSLSATPVRGVFNGVTDVDVTNNTIEVDDSSKFSVNDLVMFSNISNERGTMLLPDDGSGDEIGFSGSEPLFYNVTVNTQLTNGRGTLTLEREDGTPFAIGGTSETKNTYKQTISAAVIATDLITVSDGSKYQVGDKVVYLENSGSITGLVDGTQYTIESIVTNDIALQGVTITSTSTGSPTLTNVTANEASNFRITNLTKSKGGALAVDTGAGKNQLNYFGIFGLRYPEAQQEPDLATGGFFTITEYATSANVTIPTTATYPSAEFGFTAGTLIIIPIDETVSGIVIDSTIGRTFESLGLATKEYIDINFDGRTTAHWLLNATGEQVAKIYLIVDYNFNGDTYQFNGTIIPFASGDTNLYIQNAADSVANGWELKINENAALVSAVADPTFDLSTTQNSGLIDDTFEQVAFNSADPAVLNDVIWTYDPANSFNTSALTSVWELFLDKDRATADMLVSAGSAISNLSVKGFEQINFNVMNKMLDICEKRKDLFAIFDGVDEPRVENALEKMSQIGGTGDLSRWGAIFDGRSILNDTVYTKLPVDAVKSIEVATIITANRASGVWWLPPAGYQTGVIPGFITRQKFLRSYNYADDANSDIAKLYDANINPTRVNDQGQVIYGQKTMLKRSTALNRLNVVMLVAGIHKRFANYLDNKVFQLNTPILRSNIQAELQAKIDAIQSANPAGITDGTVICDETNNTPDIIDTNQLIVDVVIQPTRTAEFITLRTTVQRTGADLVVTNTTIL